MLSNTSSHSFSSSSLSLSLSKINTSSVGQCNLKDEEQSAYLRLLHTAQSSYLNLFKHACQLERMLDTSMQHVDLSSCLERLARVLSNESSSSEHRTAAASILEHLVLTTADEVCLPVRPTVCLSIPLSLLCSASYPAAPHSLNAFSLLLPFYPYPNSPHTDPVYSSGVYIRHIYPVLGHGHGLCG